MQDIEAAVAVGAGRIFGNSERRLRLQNHNNKQQALKCPRCDSLNTKFCYYNNYNLSQPRHFCKSCRRYWTKGGVLRNVPIGGGCRKAKRPKPKPPLPSSNSSSSENSNLTTTTNTAAANPDPCSAESGFLLPRSTTKTPNYDDGDAAIFPKGANGSFTSLMTDPYRFLEGQEKGVRSSPSWVAEEMKMQQEMTEVQNRAGLLFPPPYDWQIGSGNGDQHFYELSHAVDQAYWTPNMWVSDPDHHHHHHHPLFLP